MTKVFQTRKFFKHESASHTIDIMNKPRNFRDYKVWQDAIEYASLLYSFTKDLPWYEKKGLSDQLQRAVVSIASNIAEGAARPSDLDFSHFLDMSLGSAYEVETQLLICRKIGYLSEENANILICRVQSIQIQLSRLIGTIRNPQKQ